MDKHGFPLCCFTRRTGRVYLDAIKDANYERYGKLKTFILKRAGERGLLV